MSIQQILVIDDEDDLRNLIQTCLELMGGWQVSSADCGKEGLLKAQVEQPDAILLDVMMPEMDGFATLQQLHADTATQHIPVILLTAKGRALDQNQLAQLNVRGTISKPFNPRKLVDQVVALLGDTN